MVKDTFSFSICKQSELAEIQKFLNTYWKKGHILSKNKEVMDFYYLNKDKKQYNFEMYRNDRTNEIVAINGFTTNQTFDKNIPKLYTWGAIWKCREDVAPGLGLALHEDYLFNRPKNCGCFGVSVNPNVKLFHELFNDYVGYLNHYYFLNKKIKKFSIAKIPKYSLNEPSYAKVPDKNFKFSEIKNSSEFNILAQQQKELKCFYQAPLKSITFIKNKYEKNPFYKYHTFKISDKNEQPLGLLVIKAIKIKNACCLRIVDYLGTEEIFGELALFLQQLLERFNAEYIDIYNYGIGEKLLQKSGMLKLNHDQDEIIIPNYFEPFERRNIPILATAITNDKSERIAIFKGDADQERPNIIEEKDL